VPTPQVRWASVDEWGVPEVLSQSEIDALLNALSTGDIDASSMQNADERVVRPFDFERPSKFNKDQLRTLEMLHETFCRVVQSQLSAQLRTLVEIQVTSADQVNYGEFVRSMPFPTLINIVSLGSLEGSALLEMNLPLTLSIIDRLVGGPGLYRSRLRELTDIELALSRGVTEMMLAALNEAWSTVAPLDFQHQVTEMNPQFAQIAASGDAAVLVGFEMKVGQITGTVNLCIPHLTLEPIMDKLSAQSYFSSKRGATPVDMREIVAAEIGTVPVPVAVELGHATLCVADLLALELGDVIPLDSAPGTDISVRVGDRPAFLAQPGTHGKRVAVQITRQVEEPVQGAFS
jgi:flagellar motor switch protein FliM